MAASVSSSRLNHEQLFNRSDCLRYFQSVFKDMLNGARLMTPEEREPVQSFIADHTFRHRCHGRSLSADSAQHDCRCRFSPAKTRSTANYHGLATKDALKAKQLGNAPEAKFVKYSPPFSLSRFFRLFGQADSKLELQLPKQLVPQLETGRVYFLPSYYAP
jgi:hypothetical protein